MNPNICVFIHLEAVREYIFVINFSAICCNSTLGSLHSCNTVNIQLIVYTESTEAYIDWLENVAETGYCSCCSIYLTE